MRLSLPLLCVALLGGCDFIFRLDHIPEPDGSRPDADIPGAPAVVTGTFVRHLIRLDPSHLPQLVVMPPTLGTAAARVAFADGSQVPVAIAADGSFSFMWPDNQKPYTLTIATELTTQTFQLSLTQVALVERIGGRDGRLPPGTDVTVHLTFPTNSPPTDPTLSIAMVTTGIWTNTTFTPSNVQALFSWHDVKAASGPIGLLENGKDVAYYLEYQTVAGLGRISRFGVQNNPALANGPNNAMPFPLQAATNDHCAQPAPQPKAEIERLSALTTDVSGASASWGIDVTPNADMLPDVAISLAFHIDPSTPTDDVPPGSFQFTDPFDGQLQVGALAVQVAGNPTLTSYITVPLTSDCSPTVLPAASVNVPTAITLGGSAVDMADQMVAIDRDKLVPISWTPSDGPADYYQLALVELIGKEVLPRGLYTTVHPKVFVDPSLLVTGHTYALLIEDRIGLPAASSGDFETLGGTAGWGLATTATFGVK